MKTACTPKSASVISVSSAPFPGRRMVEESLLSILSSVIASACLKGLPFQY